MPPDPVAVRNEGGVMPRLRRETISSWMMFDETETIIGCPTDSQIQEREEDVCVVTIIAVRDSIDLQGENRRENRQGHLLCVSLYHVITSRAFARLVNRFWQKMTIDHILEVIFLLRI